MARPPLTSHMTPAAPCSTRVDTLTVLAGSRTKVTNRDQTPAGHGSPPRRPHRLAHRSTPAGLMRRCTSELVGSTPGALTRSRSMPIRASTSRWPNHVSHGAPAPPSRTRSAIRTSQPALRPPNIGPSESFIDIVDKRFGSGPVVASTRCASGPVLGRGRWHGASRQHPRLNRRCRPGPRRGSV
jgi:hypothetical protein